ncbi:hypothetical protein M9H77_02909 [Catharanthus roseus]|uniref:Uncharacterized protein n=1 Tax=Catharanthus roseus TaxID=4058 RepID=A0ACC0C9T0_CATRO|nr:hypothetical protein M9H77_02909 [Catharanthus roseus]
MGQYPKVLNKLEIENSPYQMVGSPFAQAGKLTPIFGNNELPSKKIHFEDLLRVPRASREVSPHGSLNATTPRSNGPFNCSKTTEFHQPPHFDEELHPPPYGSKSGSFGGRGMPRHFEEVPRPQPRHEKPLYDDHEHIIPYHSMKKGMKYDSKYVARK